MIDVREAIAQLGGLATRFRIKEIVVYLETEEEFNTLVGQESVQETGAGPPGRKRPVDRAGREVDPDPKVPAKERQGRLVPAPEVIVRVRTP